MDATRKEKPDWFNLVDRIKAIREVKMGNGRELSERLGVVEQRLTEYLTRVREPKAQTTLEIQEWVEEKEAEINRLPARLAAYNKALKKFAKE